MFANPGLMLLRFSRQIYRIVVLKASIIPAQRLPPSPFVVDQPVQAVGDELEDRDEDREDRDVDKQTEMRVRREGRTNQVVTIRQGREE